MAKQPTSTFPTDSVRVPTASTQAEMFLSKFPECDGRNVVVAILDTGTDPGAPGLNATCPDGRPKIIDVVDATGSGDIDMSTVRQGKLEDGKLTVEGKAGRTLTLNDGWSNPTGDFRVGAKPLYDVIPGGLASRIKKARRKVLDEAQRAATDKARTVLSEFDAAHPASKPLSEEDKAMQRELKAHLEQLENAESIVEDLGPVIDAVVWHDGSDWRAVVGTTDDGDVSALEPLTNFRTERKYGTLTGENLDPAGTLMNYAINIFDEGSVLSVVCDSGAHGTHVAGIVGACHEDAPEFNGVAPGAQIVAVKIGDSRLDGMETTSALVRGLRTVLDNGCDLINLSFGEAASPPNVGRFLEKAAEVVNKHGVIFISSAGNNGPAYTTVGAPGGTCEEIISCGAYVTPAMMEAEYSMLERVPSTMTTWSSRGPAQDGSQGVQLTAPGAAITSVPTWTLQRGMLMNGTSMSAPNLTGCVALVLSACKAHSIPVTPARVRHALISTAKPLPGADRSEVGHGIVQVDACFEYLKSRADKWKDDISYDISVSMPGHGSGAPKKGIYLREPCEMGTQQVMVSVTPRMQDQSSAPTGSRVMKSDNQLRIDFESHVLLVPTVDWIKVPSGLVLMATGRGFNVSVDTSALPEGAAHHAEILGYEAPSPDSEVSQPLFRVPVCVMKPTGADISAAGAPEVVCAPPKSLQMSPGAIHRHFIAVPVGATWAEVTVTMDSYTGLGGDRRMLYMHALQLVPHVPFSLTEHKPRWFANQGDKKIHKFKVWGGRTLELTLAQFWSSLGSGLAGLSVTFHGVAVSTTDLVLDGAQSIARIDITAPESIGSAAVSPSASLTVQRRLLRPKAGASIVPLGERDLFPDEQRSHELQQEYEIELKEDRTVTLRALRLQNRLYETPIESQLMMVYDEHKRFLGASDAWPEELKLPKGKNTVVMQIRGASAASLKAFVGMVIGVDTDLPKSLPLTAYNSANSAIAGAGKAPSLTQLAGGECMPIFFSVDDSAVSDIRGVQPGDTLLGAIKLESAAPVEDFIEDKRNCARITARYTVPPAKASDPKSAAIEPEDTRSEAEKNKEAIRDLQIKQLSATKDKEDYGMMLSELLKEYPTHLPLLSEAMERSEKDAGKAEEDEAEAAWAAVVSAAEAVLAEIDADRVQAALAKRLLDNADPATKKARQDDENLKKSLLAALVSKATAQAAVALREGADPSTLADLDSTIAVLSGWVEPLEHAPRLMVKVEKAHGRFACALKAMEAAIKKEDKGVSREAWGERADLMKELGWDHWDLLCRQSLAARFPDDRQLF